MERWQRGWIYRDVGSSCHLYDGQKKVAKCMQQSLKYYSHSREPDRKKRKKKKKKWKIKEREKERGMRYDKRLEKSWPACEHDVYCYGPWRHLKSVRRPWIRTLWLLAFRPTLCLLDRWVSIEAAIRNPTGIVVATWNTLAPNSFEWSVNMGLACV